MKNSSSNKIKESIDRIEIPSDLHSRVQKGVMKVSNENNKKKRKSLFKVWGSVAAVIIISFLTFNNETIANSIKGFFSDETKLDGTVTGTNYENATNEIDVQVGAKEISQDSTTYPLTVTVKEIDKAPYNLIEQLSLGEVNISDGSKTININKVDTEQLTLTNDISYLMNEVKSANEQNRVFTIKVEVKNEDLSNKENFLNIKSLIKHTKGDAPLEIKGDWKVPLQ